MKFAQLTGHYIRLKQKLATAYYALPWHGDHIHRLANDLASIELQLSAVSHGNKLCREHHALGRARQSIGMSMQASSTNEILISAESQPVFARGPARPCAAMCRYRSQWKTSGIASLFCGKGGRADSNGDSRTCGPF